MLVGDGHGGIAGKRRAAGEHLVEHAAGGIQVGTHVDGLAARLLGRKVLCGAHHALRLGHGGCGIVQSAGDAEVHDLDHALLGNHDVAGLDIAVDNAHAMRIVERVKHAQHHLFAVALAECAVELDDVAQGLALDVFHDDVRQTLGITAFGRNQFFARIVDVHDVRVVHLGHGVCFAAETGQEDVVVGQIGAHDFHGHGTAQTGVKSHVDLGHAATTDELAKLVASAGQCGGHTGAHCLFPPNLEAGASKTMRGVLVTRRGSRLPDVAMVVSAISVC